MMINITYYFMSCIYAILHKLNYIIVYIVYYAVTYGKQQVYVSFIYRLLLVCIMCWCISSTVCLVGCASGISEMFFTCCSDIVSSTRSCGSVHCLFSQSKLRSQPWTVFYNLHVVCPAYMIGRINDQQRL